MTDNLNFEVLRAWVNSLMSACQLTNKSDVNGRVTCETKNLTTLVVTKSLTAHVCDVNFVISSALHLNFNY